MADSKNRGARWPGRGKARARPAHEVYEVFVPTVTLHPEQVRDVRGRKPRAETHHLPATKAYTRPEPRWQKPSRGGDPEMKRKPSIPR